MKSYNGRLQRNLREGRESEQLFCDLSGAIKGTQQEDYNHIDVHLDGLTYDVKSFKPCHAKGYVLLELKNVQGKPGWCSKQGADKIALQFEKSFWIIDTQRMLRWLQDTMIRLRTATMPIKRQNGLHKKYGYEGVIYKPLGRSGRKDVFVYVRKDDLKLLVEKEYAYK